MTSVKKENKKPETINTAPRHGMLDQAQFNEKQNQDISKMLQRVALFKEHSSEEEEEEENEDWVGFII